MKVRWSDLLKAWLFPAQISTHAMGGALTFTPIMRRSLFRALLFRVSVGELVRLDGISIDEVRTIIRRYELICLATFILCAAAASAARLMIAEPSVLREFVRLTLSAFGLYWLMRCIASSRLRAAIEAL